MEHMNMDTRNWNEEDAVVSLVMEQGIIENISNIGTTLHSSVAKYQLVKRVFDIVFALIGIILLLPVFIVIALCVKLQDGGSIIYAREMVGLRNKRFTILKFRTMIPDADTYFERHPELSSEFHKSMKLQLDPRVTRLGQFLRKTYLDELPQLFNVLIGNMSFVGPRAIHERELVRYGKYGSRRHLVKPGITGLWQVSPDRHSYYEARIPLDMQYIDTCSFMTDCVVLARTCKALIFTTGV